MLNLKKNMDYFKQDIILPYQTIKLDSMLMTCGYSRETSSGYQWDGLKRGNQEFILWQYTLDGYGTLIYEGKKFKVTPGMGMLLHFPHDNFYYLPSSSPFWDFFYICFTGREAIRLCKELEQASGPLSSISENSRSVLSLVKILKKVEEGKVNEPCLCSSLCYEMVTSLIFDLNPWIGEKKQPDFIREVIDYCLLNLDKPLSVQTLSKIAGLSQFHFSRLFTKTMKLPPATYVRKLKLEKAVRMLQTEKLNVKEISDRCGFHSASYFCRAFQKAFKTTPTSFRHLK
jgi:AraC-like DNA-binding protein